MVAVRFSALVVWAALVASPAQAADSPLPPPLWEPAAAVGYLLGDPPLPAPPAPTTEPQPAARRPWNGSLPEGIVRTLFGTYRTVLSSQDMPVCGFSPSCSRFSQRAMAHCGFLQGWMLSIDRLLRDHPLAIGLYPPAGAGSRLLRDEPERYCLPDTR
jgi:putative component of membrane protein insertase Oxa1/YidC/SpoIIIJ protein YidD